MPHYTKIKSIAAVVRRVVGRNRQRDPSAQINAPLLSEAELADILRSAQALPTTWPHVSDVLHPQSGDFRSSTLGAGLDFEAARPYQPGDDIRRMDWRTTARTGKAFLKTFREEHQPQLHLVLDRGASMRFGTRAQLKVTQAARLAVMLAVISARDRIAIGATLWQPQGAILPSRGGDAGVLQLVQAAVAPCPPLSTAEAPAQSFAHLLRDLHAQLARGTRLVFISDLSQFSAGDFPMLAQLAARHAVSVYQVLDPAECELPNIGVRRFAELSSAQTGLMDTHDAAVRAQFNAASSALHQTQRRLLERAGISLRVYMTNDDLLMSAA